jgi:hypothetical protein
LKIAATASDGPPTSVVPVSMAAYDARPDGKLTEFPFTLRSRRVELREMSTRVEREHTVQRENPIGPLRRQGDIINISRIQARVSEPYKS